MSKVNGSRAANLVMLHMSGVSSTIARAYRSGERACNSAYACRDSEITKNQMRGWVAKAVVQSALTFKLLELSSSLVSL